MANWYYAIDGKQLGPVTLDELQALAAQGQLRRSDMVWNESMPAWAKAGSVAGLFAPTGPPPLTGPAEIASGSSNRIPAAICGIMLGSLGIHKFILGLTTPGVIMLLVSLLTCGVGAIVMHVIGLIEGIIYLTKSDEEFYERYIVQKREWF